MSAPDEQAVRFPGVVVQLTGIDGNAMVIIGTVTRALRRGGATSADIEEFMAEAMSGDYDNVLTTCMRWVEVD